MDERKPISKSVVAVALALILVLVLVIAAFVFGQPEASRAEIILPEVQSEVVAPSVDEPHQADALLQVDAENVAAVLASVERPKYYHQIYTVHVGKDNISSQTTVDLWVSDNLKRAQISTPRYSKTIITDGRDVYLWYNTDDNPIHLTLDNAMTFEDILGVPAFDYMQTAADSSIADAEYLVLENDRTETSCVFLSLCDVAGAQLRYWISLETGLLYEADSMEQNELVYRVQQVQYDRLVLGDESFAAKFSLPDGTEAFTEGARTQR